MRVPHVPGAPYAAKSIGRQQVAKFFADLAQGEEVQQFEPKEFIAQGDKVVVLGNYAARVNSTGRELKAEWVQIHTVREGKIVNFKEIFDTVSAVHAYGKDVTA